MAEDIASFKCPLCHLWFVTALFIGTIKLGHLCAPLPLELWANVIGELKSVMVYLSLLPRHIQFSGFFFLQVALRGIV